MAGALGVRLGGVNWYGGQAVEMPSMGDPIHPLEPRMIRDAIRLMYACSVVAWLAAMGVLVVKAAVQATGFMLQALELSCSLRLVA